MVLGSNQWFTICNLRSYFGNQQIAFRNIFKNCDWLKTHSNSFNSFSYLNSFCSLGNVQMANDIVSKSVLYQRKCMLKVQSYFSSEQRLLFIVSTPNACIFVYFCKVNKFAKPQRSFVVFSLALLGFCWRICFFYLILTMGYISIFLYISLYF